jgi:hypothetical protein
VVQTLVKAEVPVHEVIRQRADLEELFARLTDSEPNGGSAVAPAEERIR